MLTAASTRHNRAESQFSAYTTALLSRQNTIMIQSMIIQNMTDGGKSNF